MYYKDSSDERSQQPEKKPIKKTNYTSNTAKIMNKLKELESGINHIYSELGEAYFEDHRNEGESDYSAYIERIEQYKLQIRQFQKSLFDAKDLLICINCGAEVDSHSMICTSCGAKNDSGAYNSSSEKKEEFTLCINCGQRLPVDTPFCTSCGTKIGD